MSLNKKISKKTVYASGETTVENEYNLIELNKKIKKKLRSNHFYKAISTNGEDIIKVLSAEGDFQFVSHSVEAITGYSEKELLGKNILSFIAPESDKEYKDLLTFKKDWEHRKIRLIIPHKNGQPLYFESYFYFHINIDEIDLFVLICKNVTSRIMKSRLLAKGQEKEKKALELFKYLNDFSGNIISLWDLKKREPLYFNNEFPFGYNVANEADTLLSMDIIHPDDYQKVESYREKIYSVPNFNPPLVEYRLKTKDGRWEWLMNYTVTP